MSASSSARLIILICSGGLFCLVAVYLLWPREEPSAYPEQPASPVQTTTPVTGDDPSLSLELAGSADAKQFPAPTVVEPTQLARFLAAEGTDRELRRVWEKAMSGRNQEKLETALQVIERPWHPYRAEAFRILQLFLGGDIGEDPALWRQAIHQKIEKQKFDADKIRDTLRNH
jgi:hypothetical protein